MDDFCRTGLSKVIIFLLLICFSTSGCFVCDDVNRFKIYKDVPTPNGDEIENPKATTSEMLKAEVAFDQTGYFVAWKSELDPVSEGMRGSLELMLDTDFMGKNKPDFSVYHCDASEENSNKKSAVLITKNAAGSIQGFIELNDKAIIPLKVMSFMPGNKPVYFMQRFLDSGNPDMCGIYSELYIVNDGKTEALEAIEAKTGDKSKVTIGNALRTAYKIVDSERGKDLLYVHCLANKNYVKTTYYRYYFDGNKFFVEINSDKNLWYREKMLFPDMNKFRKN